MAKIGKALLMTFIIQVLLVLSGFASPPSSSLYTFLNNPTSWDLILFLSLMKDIPALAGLAGMLVGSLFRNDLLTFGGFAGVLFSFGVAYAELWGVINAAWGYEMATLIITPLIIMYVFAIFSFWRGISD